LLEQNESEYIRDANVNTWGIDIVVFRSKFDDLKTMTLSGRDFVEMGRPETITVTVRPGNKVGVATG
jgi:hypothetical protein